MNLNYFQQRELLLWASLFNSFYSEQFLLVSEASFLCSSSGGTALALGPVLCASLWRNQLALCVLTTSCLGVSSCALLKQCLGAGDLPWMVTGNPRQGLHLICTCSQSPLSNNRCELCVTWLFLTCDWSGMAPAMKISFLTPWFSQVNAEEWIESHSECIFFLFPLRNSWAEEENMCYNSPERPKHVSIEVFCNILCESNWSHSCTM